MMQTDQPLAISHLERFTNVKKSELARNEFLYALILGFAPSFLFYFNYGKTGFISYLDELMPSDQNIYYFLGLLGVQVSIMGIHYFFLHGFGRFLGFWMQIGFSILGITRAIVGAIIATMIFTVWEGDPDSAKKVLIAGLYVFALFLFSCMMMSSIQRISEELIRSSSSRY